MTVLLRVSERGLSAIGGCQNLSFGTPPVESLRNALDTGTQLFNSFVGSLIRRTYSSGVRW